MRHKMFVRTVMVCLVFVASAAGQEVTSSGFSLEDTTAPINGLPPVVRDRFADLEGRRIHEIGSHVELAEYMALRLQAFAGDLPSCESDIIHYARKNLGIPYRRGAYMFDLQQADCVTWTERVLCEALTGDWDDAYQLQFRMRFKDAQRRFAKLNHYPLADWLPNNSWLIEDITENLGVPVAQLDVRTDRQQRFVNQALSAHDGTDLAEAESLSGAEVSLTTAYIPVAAMATALDRVRIGDLIFFIANYPDLDNGNATRPLCMHQGIIHREGGEVRVLHAIAPEASEWSLQRFIQKRLPRNRFLGIKVARLRANARQLVSTELAGANIATVSPDAVDAQFNVGGIGSNGVLLVRASRPPDAEVTIGDITYGAVDLEPGETLYSLFRRQWEYVYNHDINAPFRVAHPDPHEVPSSSNPGRILYPMRRADRSGR